MRPDMSSGRSQTESNKHTSRGKRPRRRAGPLRRAPQSVSIDAPLNGAAPSGALRIGPMALVTDPVESAHVAGLRYVTGGDPGLRRRRSGKGFIYIGLTGKRISDADTIGRIRRMAIPPAWTDVWICPDPNGHLQAVGRDARGRKQYRYHPDWRQVRDETKYTRMIPFARALPVLRRRVEADLSLTGLPREKVLATVVRLLEATLIRVGNEEYARHNASYGLTTLRDRHVDVSGSVVRFEFKGKSGVRHAVDLRDRRLAKIIKDCQDLPGYELFQYVDESGSRCSIGSGDVNAYLREITGQDFTAKDFRTWAGTVLAAQALLRLPRCRTVTEAKKNVVQVVAQVAERLGNTRAVCRKCYIHPAVIDRYLDLENAPLSSLMGTVKTPARSISGKFTTSRSPEEKAVLRFLEHEIKREAREKKRVVKRQTKARVPRAWRGVVAGTSR
jgi:DNA topoisomerase I